jgi:hypothetical protein
MCDEKPADKIDLFTIQDKEGNFIDELGLELKHYAALSENREAIEKIIEAYMP